MNEKLLKRIAMGSAVTIVVSYFLPWMSLMTPFGTIQLKGQFLDYAWLVLLFSILYLITAFSIDNADAFGFSPAVLPKLRLAERIAPILLLGFIAWAGSVFEFRLHMGNIASLFGGDAGAEVHAGLDYGYWLAVLSVICLIFVLAIRTKEARRFSAASVGVVAIAVVIALATNRPSRVSTVATSSSIPNLTSSSASTPTAPAESAFDSSPYVTVLSATGKIYEKDVEEERFDDSVAINLEFQNLTNKIVVGLRGRVEVLDGFGKDVYSFGFRDDDKILPKSSEGRGSYAFEHNQFEDDNPFSKMYPLIRADTARYKVTITNIAFSDGTMLPSK